MQEEQVILHEIAAEGRLGQVAMRQTQHEFVPGIGGPDIARGGDQAPEQLAGDYHRNSMLRVAAGNRTVSPSSSSVMMIWQPSREVAVRPKARSSMSSSSSLASFSSSYHSGSTITWHVEQASEPSQAPSISMSLRCATSSTDRPSGASTSRRVPSRSVSKTALPPTEIATSARAPLTSIPTAAPGASGSEGEPSGSSI